MIRTGVAGHGTYGHAYNAIMSKNDKTEIVVKRNIIDKDVSFSASIRELDLLSRLRGHPYIVKLISVSFGNPFIAPNSPILDRKGCSYREDYLHFVFEKGEKNLHNLIYEKTVHVSYLKLAMVQILLGVEYMHAKGVIHRDIKPANLLWFVDKGRTSVKLCDFGLSKIKTFQEPSSPHVVTCWYRAPEICAHDKNYSYSSDMWSVGSVMYEMIARQALLAGYKDDDNKLLSRIIGLMPEIKDKELSKYDHIKLNKEASPRLRKSWKDMIHLTPEEIVEFNKYPGDGSDYESFLDLLDKILQIDPEKRYTASDALKHPFCSSYNNIIEWSHTNFPLTKVETVISIHDCKERKWAIKLAFQIFNSRENLDWYCHRIIFQSIDMFDRYLIYLKKIGKEKLESDFSGKLMTRYETQLRYIVCLYMSIKYFTTLKIPIPFTELATDDYKTPKAMIEAEEFEQKMLRDVLRFKVYRETIFEAIDKLPEDKERIGEHKIRDLLYLYGTSPSQESISPFSLLQKFLDTQVP